MTIKKLFMITNLAVVVLALITGAVYQQYRGATQLETNAFIYQHEAFLLSEEMETDSSDLTN